MFEKQREIDVTAWGYDQPVVLKRLNAGESEAYTNAATKGAMKGGRKDQSLDMKMGTGVIIYVQHCIVSAPFENKLEALRTLDGPLIDYLYEQAQEVNSSPLAQKSSSSD
jgi:hypothetical protein